MNASQQLARWMFLSAHRREHPRGRPPGRGGGGVEGGAIADHGSRPPP